MGKSYRQQTAGVHSPGESQGFAALAAYHLARGATVSRCCRDDVFVGHGRRRPPGFAGLLVTAIARWRASDYAGAADHGLGPSANEIAVLWAVRVNGDGHISIGITGECRIARTKCRDYLRHRHPLPDVVAHGLAVVDGGLGIGERDPVVVQSLYVLIVLIWCGNDR
jgi:hypothetical protein